MGTINRESRTSVYFQMSFVLAMRWLAEKSRLVDFEKSLLDRSLEFSQTNSIANSFTMLRTEPSNLQVKLHSPAPQLCSIQIIGVHPGYELEMFSKDCSAVTEGYKSVWSSGQYQIVQATAKIQHLYSSQSHAFEYLWEQRLGQSPDDFRCFGQRPVAGGGLRLVMPPHAGDGEEPRSIELRIESFLREPRKLMIETAFVWPKPKVLQKDDEFGATAYLAEVESYATNEVWMFLTHSKDD